MSQLTKRKNTLLNWAGTMSFASPRRHFSLAAVHTSGLLVALCLALACGHTDPGTPSVPRSPPADEDIFTWSFGQDVRVTGTGESEVALMVIKAPLSKSSVGTRADARELIACGEIDDFLPSHPSTDEYFFVVGGELQIGTIKKGAPRTTIVIDRPIRISRLLLLEKSSPGLVLLVEETPKPGEERGPLWRLSITGKSAKAKPELARSIAEYKRDFRNPRCEQGDSKCLHIGSDVSNRPVLDIESRPGVPREPYMTLDFWIYRAVFHPKQPDTVLLLASCSK